MPSMVRTRRVRNARELRRMLGRDRLAGSVIACVGGEWRQEGSGLWRFWQETGERAPAQGSEPRPEPWWDR